MAIIPFRIFVVQLKIVRPCSDRWNRRSIKDTKGLFSVGHGRKFRGGFEHFRVAGRESSFDGSRSIAASVSHEYIHKRRRRPTARVRDKDVNWWLGKRFPPLKIVLLAQDRRTPRHPPVQISFLSLPSTLMSSVTGRKRNSCWTRARVCVRAYVDAGARAAETGEPGAAMSPRFYAKRESAALTYNVYTR